MYRGPVSSVYFFLMQYCNYFGIHIKLSPSSALLLENVCNKLRRVKIVSLTSKIFNIFVNEKNIYIIITRILDTLQYYGCC